MNTCGCLRGGVAFTVQHDVWRCFHCGRVVSTEQGATMNGECACAWRKGIVFKDGALRCASCGLPMPRQEPSNEELGQHMRDVYNACSTSGTAVPSVAVMSGALVNLALGPDAADPAAAYVVSETWIDRMRDDDDAYGWGI